MSFGSDHSFLLACSDDRESWHLRVKRTVRTSRGEDVSGASQITTGWLPLGVFFVCSFCVFSASVWRFVHTFHKDLTLDDKVHSDAIGPSNVQSTTAGQTAELLWFSVAVLRQETASFHLAPTSMRRAATAEKKTKLLCATSKNAPLFKLLSPNAGHFIAFLYLAACEICHWNGEHYWNTNSGVERTLSRNLSFLERQHLASVQYEFLLNKFNTSWMAWQFTTFTLVSDNYHTLLWYWGFLWSSLKVGYLEKKQRHQMFTIWIEALFHSPSSSRAC